MKILIVEDEPALRISLVDHLQRDGYRCEEAATYDQAHEKIKLYRYDCVLVDLTLPGGTGLDLVRTLKADDSPAGVLIVSARGALDDKVTGLQLTAPKMAKSGKMAHAGHAKMEHDHMMMKDGKMMMMKGGQMTPMTETMTLSNGTQVMADGTCMMKDGKKMMLKEGQEIGTDGKMHMDTPHDKKMAEGKMKGKM